MGFGCVQRGNLQAAAVGQVGTNLIGVKRDVGKEVSVNEEDLLGRVTFQSKESILDVCVGAKLTLECMAFLCLLLHERVCETPASENWVLSWL